MGVKLRLAKFQPFTPRGTFPNWGLNGEGQENVRFSTKNWPYLRKGET